MTESSPGDAAIINKAKRQCLHDPGKVFPEETGQENTNTIAQGFRGVLLRQSKLLPVQVRNYLS